MLLLWVVGASSALVPRYITGGKVLTNPDALIHYVYIDVYQKEWSHSTNGLSLVPRSIPSQGLGTSRLVQERRGSKIVSSRQTNTLARISC
jgi:hypothetical protein